jgi:hypothetical protein
VSVSGYVLEAVVMLSTLLVTGGATEEGVDVFAHFYRLLQAFSNRAGSEHWQSGVWFSIISDECLSHLWNFFSAHQSVYNTEE